MWYRRHCVWAVVLLAALAPARSQSSAGDLPIDLPVVLPEGASPPLVSAAKLFINGPTGISVETEHHRAMGVRDFVNGPTGTSWDVEEDKPPSGVKFLNGPMGTSVAEQEQRAAEAATVEEPTEEPETEGGAAGGRSVGRGVISTDPRDNPGIKQLPPGLHIDTTDWSRDAGLWSYQGGDWALVDLPAHAHPAIPHPGLPGKALLVVTPALLKKVRVMRVFRSLSNVTLHYRFFLSQGQGPHGVPELKVYQVAETMSSLLVSETSRGAWSDTTIKLPYSGAFTIVFEGRLMQEGNEIAIDDIAISGNSLGAQEISRAKSELIDTSSQTPDKIPQTQDASHTTQLHTQDASHTTQLYTQDALHTTQLNNEENVTSKHTTESLEGITGNDTTQHENSTVSEAVSPSTDTENVTEVSQKPDTPPGIVNFKTPVVNNANGTEVVDELNNGNNSSGDWVEETIELQGPNKMNDNSSGDWSAEYIELPGQHTNVGNELKDGESENFTADSLHTRGKLTVYEKEQNRNDSNLLGNDPSDKDDLMKNETEDFSITTGNNMSTEDPGTMVTSPTTETGLTGEDNQTQIETTSVNNNNGEPTHDNTTITLTPSQPPTPNTGNNTLTNTSENPDNTNNTFIPSESQQLGDKTTTGPLGVTTTASSGVSQPINTGNGESINTSTSPTSPSGVLMTDTTTNTTGTNTPVVMGTDSPRKSWRVFQVFLVLCTLGLLGLGFLYWRKKRRQDDEIPMFTRQTHTDYHNPTFSVDDDASFMSRGSRHNYKSFE